jgi:hypothetical protein
MPSDVSVAPASSEPASRPAAERPPTRQSGDTRAALAVGFGVLGAVGAMLGLGLVFGLPAVVLGALALRDHRGGARGDRRLAWAGVALGALGSALFFVWVGLMLRFVHTTGVDARADAPAAPVVVDVPLLAPVGEPASGMGPRAPAVELHRTGGPLRVQLAKQASSARAAGQVVLVETVSSECDACDEVTRALFDPRMRAALASVRLVGVDVSEFRSELGRLRMDENTAPWFYLIDARGEPLDAISADEWDDNDAAQIAPVLHAFVRGDLRARRHGYWHGGATL